MTAAPRPEVLVVMPMHDTAAWVGKAVESILTQTFRDLRLVVVDDGSSDESAAAATAAAAGDPRFTLVRQANQGQAAAANRGQAIAEAERIPYLARMDSDDLSHPERIADQLGYLAAFPAAAACGCNCRYIDTDGRPIGMSTTSRSSARVRWELRHGLRGIIQGATLFRTSALASVGGYRPEFRQSEDVDLFLRLGERYELFNSPRFLYDIRLRATSVSMRDVASNSLFAFWAADGARRRARGESERGLEEFVAAMGARTKLRLARESLTLRLWRRAMQEHRQAPLVLAALLDPRRVVARALRAWDNRHG